MSEPPDIEGIRKRQARREAQQCDYHGAPANGCHFGEEWLCLNHHDPEDTEADVRALLAEVTRLKEVIRSVRTIVRPSITGDKA